MIQIPGHKNDSRQNIVGAVANLARDGQGGKLKSLVLNCHGAAGYLIMGEGFWNVHTGMFQAWQGLVDTIWITACEIASRVPNPNVPAQSGDGFLFCQQMAINARCNVVASLHTQWVPRQTIPNGSVDSFEGRLLCWKPDGNVAWARLYPMTTVE